jgi:hypothetical protein
MPEPRPGSDPNCALAYECLHLDVERPRHSIRLVFDAYITSSPVPKRVVEGIVSLSRHMSDELTRHMSDFGFWVACLRQEAPDAVKSDIDGGDTDGAV